MGTLTKKSRVATTSRGPKVVRTAVEKPNAVLNEAGGLAYTIPDSAQKLIFVTGQFIGEPKYYDGFGITPVSSGAKIERGHALDASLAEKGVVKWATSVLDENTKTVVQTAFAVANSDNPRDLLVISNWLRSEMNMRLSPALFLAVAGKVNKTKPFVRDYCSKVIQRLDDVFNVVLFWNLLFQGRLPNSLSRGLADALAKFDEYAIMKYGMRDEHPNLKDTLKIVDRRANFPYRKEIVDFVFNGKVPAKDVSLQIWAWNELKNCKKFDDLAQELAKQAKVTWEDLSSQFGQSDEAKKAVWTFLVNNKQLPYMATLRNLSNLVRAGVEADVIEKACAFLSNPDQVRKSRQMPFRFLAASRAVEETIQTSGIKVDPFALKSVQNALEEALMIASEGVTALTGKTACYADNSGSMDSKISDKSEISNSDVANVLCTIMAKRSNAIVGAFGTECAMVNGIDKKSLLDSVRAIKEANTMGMSTNGHKCIDKLLASKTVVDRVIIFTDCQLWNSEGSHMTVWGCEGSLAVSWEKYEKFCKAQGAKVPYLHFVNLAGTDTVPVDSGKPNVNLLGGFSEKILNQCAVFEAGKNPVDGSKAMELPTIEDLRKRF